MGTLHFRPPKEFTSLNRSPTNFARVIMSTTTTPVPYLGGLWANGWNITQIIFIYTLFCGTHLQVRPVDGFSCSNDVDSRKDVLLGFCPYCTPFRGSNSPQTPILESWIDVFQPFVSNIEPSIFSKLLHWLHSDRDNVLFVGDPN